MQLLFFMIFWVVISYNFTLFYMGAGVLCCFLTYSIYKYIFREFNQIYNKNYNWRFKPLNLFRSFFIISKDIISASIKTSFNIVTGIKIFDKEAMINLDDLNKKSDFIYSAVCCFITVTPGSITMYQKDDSRAFVHCLYKDTYDTICNLDDQKRLVKVL